VGHYSVHRVLARAAHTDAPLMSNRACIRWRLHTPSVAGVERGSLGGLVSRAPKNQERGEGQEDVSRGSHLASPPGRLAGVLRRGERSAARRAVGTSRCWGGVTRTVPAGRGVPRTAP
jgi:hypothetical protein